MINLIINIILLHIAIVLFLTFGLIGFFFEIGFRIWSGGIKGLSDYILEVASSIDQLGNTTAGILLSLIFLNRNSSDHYLFGNKDETVSGVLGKNKRNGTLSRLGKIIDSLLEFLDKNHTIKSIEDDENHI